MDLSPKGLNSLALSVNHCKMMVEDAGRKEPVLADKIAAAEAKRTMLKPSNKRTVIPSLPSILDLRESSSKPAAKKQKSSPDIANAGEKRKEGAYDPLRQFNKKLTQKVLVRMSKLSQFQELQTKFKEILMLAVKNPAVRDELCRLLNLSEKTHQANNTRYNRMICFIVQRNLLVAMKV